jgi:hypothetical protein
MIGAVRPGMSRTHDHETFELGDRVRLTSDARSMVPHGSPRGVVVGFGRKHRAAIRVVRDGTSTRETWAAFYWERDVEPDQSQ